MATGQPRGTRGNLDPLIVPASAGLPVKSLGAPTAMPLVPAVWLLGSAEGAEEAAGAAVPGAVHGPAVWGRRVIHAARRRRTSNTSPRAAA